MQQAPKKSTSTPSPSLRSSSQPRESIPYRRAKLYPKQEEAIFAKARYSLIEATTKSGKTSGCIVWLVEMATMGKPGANYWWVAPVYPQAKIAYARMVRSMPQGTFEKNDTELRIDLLNQTHIWFKSGEKPDNLYGEEVYAGVLDEASRMREEAFIAVRTTLTATKGPMRIIGNVKGKRNWFYKMSRKAEAGEKDMAHHKITWRDAVGAHIFDESEVDDARRVLPEQAFKQLYEAEPADDEGNPFGLEAIRACTIPEFSKEPIVAWGWDLGKHQTWTVGVALTRKRQMARFVRFQAPWNETKRRIIAETGGRGALVDMTGVGDPIVEDLSRTAGNFEGFVFTPRTKQDLMALLQSDIQQRRLGLTGSILLNELESFEYEYRGREGRFTGVFYSAPPGGYDDCVMALGLADRKLGPGSGDFRFERVQAPKSVDGDPDGSADNRPGVDPADAGAAWEGRSGLI